MRPVVVSFNQTAALALRWSEEVGAQVLPHLYDPAPDGRGGAGGVYAAFRFLRSVAGVWSPKALRFYASQQMAGRELHSAQGQDVHVLAGDFVLAPDGTVALPYYSRDNTDRPDVADLLVLAEQLQARYNIPALALDEMQVGHDDDRKGDGQVVVGGAASSAWWLRRTLVAAALACAVAGAVARRRR